jgi:hypothetical protein
MEPTYAPDDPSVASAMRPPTLFDLGPISTPKNRTRSVNAGPVSIHAPRVMG